MRLVLILIAAVGCKVALETPTTDDPAPTDSGTEPTTPPPPACDATVRSSCDNPSSIVQGHVRLGDGIDVTQGDLYIALMHEAYDGAVGGGYHIATRIPNADLSEPVPFAFDMCAGGEMWTEENCTYSLQVILDQNGDQSETNVLPSRGEPSARVAEVRVSCSEAPPCLDVVLDCMDGPTCTSFDSLPTCECETASCASPIVLCN